MSFNEKLERYKNGQLNDSEMAEVREEIEKYSAISEYLFDEDSLDDNLNICLEDACQASEIEDESRAMTDNINGMIRKAFIKAGVITATIAIIMSLLLAFVMPHIVSAFFYNPDKTVYNDVENGVVVNQMTKDLSVYTEARMPEYGPNISVSVDSQGYGKYYIYANSWFSSGDVEGETNENGFAGMITRNNSTWYTPKAMEFESADPQTFTGKGLRNTDKLEDNGQYYTYVSFKKPISYEDFLSLYNTHSEILGQDNGFIWCAVKTSEKIEGNLGFFMTDSGQSSIEYEDNSDYPLLRLTDAKVESTYIESEEAATEHFTSMMKYLADNEDLLEIMDGFAEPDVYHDAAKYVESNGLQIYGFVIVTDKAHISKLSKVQVVSGIKSEPVS